MISWALIFVVWSMAGPVLPPLPTLAARDDFGLVAVTGPGQGGPALSPEGRLDAEEAMRNYQELLERSRRARDLHGVAESLYRIGNLQLLRRDLRAALRSYAEGLEAARAAGDKLLSAALLERIGEIHRIEGRRQESLDAYTEALRLARELGDRPAIAQTLDGLGALYRAWDRDADAFAAFQESLVIRRQVGDKRGEAQTLNQLAQLYLARGDHQGAMAAAQEALTLSREVGDRLTIAESLNALGGVEYRRRNLQQALQYFSEYLQIAVGLGEEEHRAQALHNLGLVQIELGNYAEALRNFQEFLRQSQGPGQREALADVLHNIGRIQYLQGNYRDALKYFEDSLRMGKGVVGDARAAETLASLGGVHRALGNYSQALDRFREARDLYQRVGEKGRLADLIVQIEALEKAVAAAQRGVVVTVVPPALPTDLTLRFRPRKGAVLRYRNEVVTEADVALPPVHVVKYDLQVEVQDVDREENVSLRLAINDRPVATARFSPLLRRLSFSRLGPSEGEVPTTTDLINGFTEADVAFAEGPLKPGDRFPSQGKVEIPGLGRPLDVRYTNTVKGFSNLLGLTVVEVEANIAGAGTVTLRHPASGADLTLRNVRGIGKRHYQPDLGTLVGEDWYVEVEVSAKKAGREEFGSIRMKARSLLDVVRSRDFQ